MKKLLLFILLASNAIAQTPFPTFLPTRTRVPTATSTPTATATVTPWIVCNPGGSNELPSTGVGGRPCYTVTSTATSTITPTPTPGSIACPLPTGVPDIGFISFDAASSANSVECFGFGTYSLDPAVTRGIWSTNSFKVSPTAGGFGFCEYYGSYLNSNASGDDSSLLSNNRLFHNFWFRVDLLPSLGEMQIVRTRAPGPPNANWSVHIDPSGALKFRDQDAGTLRLTTPPIATTVWHKIGIFADGNLGTFELVIDNVSQGSGIFAGFLPSTDRVDYGAFILGSASAVTYYYDDISVSTTGFPGDLRMSLAKPISQGVNQWTAGTGPSDYTQVNEDPPSAAEYMRSTGVAGDATYFGLTSRVVMNNTVGRVIAIKPFTYMGTLAPNGYEFGFTDGVSEFTKAFGAPLTGTSTYNSWVLSTATNGVPMYNALYDTGEMFVRNGNTFQESMYTAYTFIAVDADVASPLVCTPVPTPTPTPTP